MTREEWQEKGRTVVLREKRATWELAWWLVEGREWDSDFQVSAELTGYSRSHLWNLFRVGHAYPPGTPHPDLSMSVYRELLREPNRDARAMVLSEVLEHGWTTQQVVQYFEKHPPTKVTPDLEPVPPGRRKTKAEYSRQYYVGAHVQCPSCGHIHPVKGHKVASDAVAPEVAERRDPAPE